MIIRVAAFLILLFSVCAVRAAEASYVHYTIDEGLPSNEVYDVYEDSLGYIWFATDHGISQFDGYSFRNFSTADGLTHNTIFGFYEDHRGWIWMRAFNGTMCYMRGGKIFAYKHNDKLQKFLGPNFVQRYAFDKAGNLWFLPITLNGLYCQDAVTGEIRRTSLPTGYNAFIRRFDSGECLGGIDLANGFTQTSVLNDSVITDQQSLYFRMPFVPEGARRQVIHLRKSAPDHFVFAYERHIVVLKNGVISMRQSFDTLVNTYYIDPLGQHWIGLNGFSKFLPGSSPEAPYLSGSWPCDMLQDRMQNHWFATLNNGVFLARDLQVSILNTIGGTAFDNLIHMEPYDTFLVFMDKECRFFQLPKKTSVIYSAKSRLWASPYSAVNTFAVNESADRLYLGEYYSISPNGIDPHLNRMSGPVNTAGIRDYHIAGDSLLIACNSAWSVCDSACRSIYNSSSSSFRAFCTAIMQDRNRHILIGTSDGLYRFENGETVPYRPSDSLFRQRVTDLAEGPNGELIVSTRGGGIIIEDGMRVYNLRASDGLASDQCASVCVDDSVVWIASNSGLTKMTLIRNGEELTFTFSIFNNQHGLPSEMINGIVRTGDQLFLATGHGLAWFDPDAFRFNATPPPVYITSFLVNSREINPDTTPLTWSDRNVSLGFLGLLYKSQGLVHYRYQLEGYESEWHYTTERVAHYFNLPPGTYRFVVSAMNENGIWNEHAAIQEFIIPAHYSETTWFRLLMVALVAGVLAVIVFLFFRQQRTKAKAALDLALAEQKALRAQMKPHFIFNSLNSIQNFIINRDEESAHLYLTRFAHLMRRILDHSRKGMVALEEEIETMRIYLDLEKLRFGENFQYAIDNQTGLPATVLMIPPLFIQPFAENAIWHGLQMQKNNPVLRIHYFIKNNRLHCVIEDNGIGRKRAAEFRKQGHASTGMKNVEERIAVLNATSRDKISVSITDLSDADGTPTGTRVEILFPVVRNDEE